MASNAGATYATDIGGMAGTGATIGSAFPGYGTAIGGIIGALVGTGMAIWQTNQADQTTSSAQGEARGMYNQQIATTARQQAFDNSITLRQQKQTEVGQQAKITETGINAIQNMLNNNTGLQKMVLQKWGM